jgi:hypothetical protein
MGLHPEWSEIADWIGRSTQILIKKLSRNDCSWADDPGKHQAGFYVPASVQQSRFFPELRNTNSDKPHILDTFYRTFWPATGEVRLSALKHYTNKGSEFHCTRIPHDQFSGLSPASLLLGGKLEEPIDGAVHWFSVVDSASQEAEIIETVFSLQSDFHFGLFSPNVLIAPIRDEEQLIAELNAAIRDGTLDRYAAMQSMPDPANLALQAQQIWLHKANVPSLDPFSLEAPGDAVMSISRDIEFTLYKQAELRQRASQAAQLLLHGSDPVASLVRSFSALDKLFLSAAQTRKSRAGLSFEHHVRRLLVDGRIHHEAQIVLGSRRPDFVLPDVVTLNNPENTNALILSLKTTLRERWKQLGLERRHGAVFLATVDDRVSTPAIKEMASNDIVLVVPESLKKSKEAVYEKETEVITFHDFFHDQIKIRRPSLLIA